jgi:FG-GAP repeat protein/hemolysin type calcium-binding protein
VRLLLTSGARAARFVLRKGREMTDRFSGAAAFPSTHISGDGKGTGDRSSCAAASRSSERRRLDPPRRRGTLAMAALALGLALVVPASAALIVTESKLIPPGGGEAGALFGHASALDGDTAVVGAPMDDTTAGVDAGSAFVYVRSNGTWSLQQELTAGDGAAGDLFGSSVSVDGDTLIVGARADTHTTETNAGSAYVFVRFGTTWTLQQKLTASDGKKGDGFGFSVATDGDLALVGSWADDSVGGRDAGSAYVFRRAGTIWTEEQKLRASDGEPRDVFGAAVSLSGQTALIGAFGDDGLGGADEGSAYVFIHDGTKWIKQQKLTPSGAEPGALAGYSVDLIGDVAVLGSPLDDAGVGADAGVVNVFLRNGTVWTEQQPLVAGDAAAGDEFGISVGIDGGTIVVGAALDDTTAGSDAGSAYIFMPDGPTWTQTAHLRASDGAAGDNLGFSAAFSVDTALAGARGDDSSAGADAGSAYAFALRELAGCTRNGSTLSIEVAAGTTTIGRSGVSITVNGVPCADATVDNIDTINVVGTTDSELLQLDLTGGQFAPGLTPEGSGASEIELAIDLGGGNDTLLVQYGALGDRARLGSAGINLNLDDDSDVTLVGIEGVTVNGGAGDDTISGAGNAGTGGLFPLPLVLNGDSGRDKLTGGAANDVQNGGDGNDTLSANKNQDGADVLNGGADKDSTSYAARGSDVVVTLDGLANDGGSGGAEGDNVQTEKVTGGKANDTLDGGPTASNNTLEGGNGNDTVLGRDGNDMLEGGTGADNLQGGNGNDNLKARDGTSGNDSADGGAGTDVCTADAGDTVLNCEA